MNEVPLGGGSVTTLARGQNNPVSVAVDGTHVYWADRYSRTIGRANLNGTGVNHSFITGANRPTGVAVAHVASPPRDIDRAHGEHQPQQLERGRWHQPNARRSLGTL